MIKKILFTVLIILGFTLSATASGGGEKATFKVSGNCGMCERTIESAALGVKGVKSADWDKETKEISVVFNPDKASLEDIKKAIASSGYDTDTQKASDEAYNGLHGCCQYDREQ